MYYILIIFLIVFIFIYLNKFEKFVNYNNSLIFNKNQYNNFILKNKDKTYKVNIIKNKEDIKDCYKKCNFSDCLKLDFF